MDPATALAGAALAVSLACAVIAARAARRAALDPVRYISQRDAYHCFIALLLRTGDALEKRPYDAELTESCLEELSRARVRVALEGSRDLRYLADRAHKAARQEHQIQGAEGFAPSGFPAAVEVFSDAAHQYLTGGTVPLRHRGWVVYVKDWADLGPLGSGLFIGGVALALFYLASRLGLWPYG
ncbi:hypothetical protein OG453_23665 [Streptomyces sp. NBC_01381]|uniref:hypothetical protein n=1 Tax=Streptomyces sp. NBC_01381 TaxID=2903845 RepID=UPI002257127D|nr:hypothetical protein [Streptomyces sp. NBC_01381]MCX4669645.1 hypothetical protein [Streptomyces sp. NBC_01381]